MSAAVYADHAATTPLRPEAREAMAPFFNGSFGNPSGWHAVSRRAKAALERAREEAADLLGAAHPLDIVFTGGGTESDNLGVAGPALSRGGGVVTTAVEHEAVLNTARFVGRLGHTTTIVGVDEIGLVNPDDVAAAVDDDTTIVSVMTANNETGVRQPLTEIVAALRDLPRPPLIHTDAVQAFSSTEVTLEGLGVDLITLSAHKFGGPQGVGLLHLPRSIPVEPVIHGGGQEIGRRSGTPNVAGIAGMAAAMAAAAEDRARFCSEVGAVRGEFEATLQQAVPGVEFTAPPESCLVQHCHFRVPGIDAETLLIRLDRAGIAASAGAACHSGAIGPSHVLTAMGLDEGAARSSVRISFGWTSRLGEGRDAARAIGESVEALR